MSDDVAAKRVRIVVDEVQACRIAGDRASIERFVAKAFTLPEAEAEVVVRGALGIVSKLDRREVAQEPPLSPKRVLRGKALARVAATYFERTPDATARDVYRRMKADGHRIAMSESSFVNGQATAARKLVGVKGRTGSPSLRRQVRAAQEEEEQADEPAAESKSSSDAERVDASVKALPARKTSSDGEDSPTGSSQPPVATGTAGDRILLELGGQRFDAKRRDDAWDVEFEGTVGDAVVRDLLGRMLSGVGT